MSQPGNFNRIALDSAARIVRFLDDIDRAYDRRRESGNPLGESDNPDVKAYCWPGWDRERVIASIIMAEMAREEIEGGPAARVRGDGGVARGIRGAAHAMTTDHEDRLRAMLEPDQETWDLSPNDTRAIRWALDELESLRARVAELEGGLSASPAPPEPPPAAPDPSPPLFARELDTRAIRWALDEIDRLRARVAELEAGLAAPDPSPPLFARELATYERLRPVLLTYAEGQYAVILGDTCHAVERTYEAALRVAYDGLGPVPFLIKQVLAEPELVRGMRPS